MGPRRDTGAGGDRGRGGRVATVVVAPALFDARRAGDRAIDRVRGGRDEGPARCVLEACVGAGGRDRGGAATRRAQRHMGADPGPRAQARARAQSGRVRLSRAGPGPALPVDRSVPVERVCAGAAWAGGMVAGGLARSYPGRWSRGAREACGRSSRAGRGAPARQPRGAASGGLPGVSRHGHDPRALDFGAARGDSGDRSVSRAAHAGRAAVVGARHRRRVHGALRRARGSRDARRAGHAARLALVPGSGARPPVAGAHGARRRGDRGRGLASAGGVSGGHAVVVFVDGCARGSRGVQPVTRGERRSDRAAHRREPQSARAPAAPLGKAGRGRRGGRHGDLGRHGPDRGGHVSRRQSDRPRPQSTHRAARAGGDGVGVSLPALHPGVDIGGGPLWRGLQRHARRRRVARGPGRGGARWPPLGRGARCLVGGWYLCMVPRRARGVAA